MKNFKLDNEPKITSGFTTPDGYFEEFSSKIIAELPKEDSKIISIFSYRKTLYFAAAAILILILCTPLFFKYSTQTDEIDSATLENYIAYQANISDEEIVNLLQQEDLDKIKLEFNVSDAAIEEVLNSNSNIEQYLID